MPDELAKLKSSGTMKYFYIFALFFCLISLSAAIPIPSGPSGSQPPKLDKGKGRADRPKTPTPEHNPDVPLPGRSGLHTDQQTKVATFYYGDDDLPAPRPQNRGHYLRQLQQKKDEEAKRKAASGVTKPSQPPQPKKDDKGKQKEKPLTAEEAKKEQRAAENLRAFESKFGPAKRVGEVAEALETRADRPAQPRPPSPAAQHPSHGRPPSPAAQHAQHPSHGRPPSPAGRPPSPAAQHAQHPSHGRPPSPAPRPPSPAAQHPSPAARPPSPPPPQRQPQAPKKK